MIMIHPYMRSLAHGIPGYWYRLYSLESIRTARHHVTIITYLAAYRQGRADQARRRGRESEPCEPFSTGWTAHTCSHSLQRVYKLPIYFPEPSIHWPSNLKKLAAETPRASTSTSTSAAPVPLLLKHRFPKTYRHPHQDALLTKQRIQSESRSLLRCLKAGITVPMIRMVDLDAGMIGMEWIDGWSVREVLGGGAEGEEADPEDEEIVDEDKARRRKEAEGVLDAMGITIGAFVSPHPGPHAAH